MAGLLGIIALLVLAVAAPAASAAPWSCTAYGYLFQSPEGMTGAHRVEQVDLATGEYSTLVTTEGAVNAVGYNALDDYMYGVSRTETAPGKFLSHLQRINADGTFEEIPWPATVPQEASYFVGDVDSAGHYYLARGAVSYLIDLAPGSPTYGELIEEGEYGHTPGFAAPLDVAYIDGAYYGVSPSSAGGGAEAHLMRYTMGAAPVDLGALAGVPSPGAFGAVYADASGYLYASNNATGNIYRINPATLESLLVAEGPVSSSNDGARCAGALIPTLTLTKAVGGRIRPNDQFTVSLVGTRGKTVESASTEGRQTTVSTTNFPVSQGKTYTITDAMAPGSTSVVGEYAKSIACVDATGAPVATSGSGPDWRLTVATATFYSCTVTNKVEADLAILKTVTPSPVVPGQKATFALEVTNSGPSTSIGEKVTDRLPGSFSLDSTPAGCAASGDTVTCALGELGPGGSRTFRLTGKVSSTLHECLRNTATVSGATDPHRSDNAASICPPVEPRADLELTKTAAPRPIVPGKKAAFTLRVTNKGPSTSPGGTVTDRLPRKFTLGSSDTGCAVASGTVTCKVGELAPGASQAFRLSGKVAASLRHCLANTATVSSAADPNPANDSASVCAPLKGNADLMVTKTPAAKTVVAGGQIAYTLTVKNKGPSDATGVKVEDPMGSGLAPVSAQPSQGKCASVDGGFACDLGYLAAGGTAQVLVTATATATSGQVHNKARVHGDQEDPEPENNEGEVTVVVNPPPPDPPAFDLQVRKVTRVKHPTVGQALAYRIVVGNNGPAAAPDVRLTDTYNAPARLLSVKPSAGTCSKHIPIGCELGTIQPGAKVTIEVRLRPAKAGRNQRNAAGVTGSGNDLNLKNNLDVVKRRVARVKLRLTKVASRATVRPGQRFSYLIRLKNVTRGIARHVRVCDRLPAGVAPLGAQPKGRLESGRLCWGVKRLGAKQTRAFRVTVRALRAAGRKVNRVRAGGPDAKTARASSAVRIIPAPPKPTPVTG